MPTTVVKSIGSGGGRDYSTLQAWEDACPANLVTADQVWKGECYNDSEFSGTSNRLTVSGITTDATRYVWLTTATGQSFRDHADKATNPLRYDQAKGVGITASGTYDGTVTVDVAYTVLENLQIKITSGSSYTFCWALKLGSNGVAKNCILEGNKTGQHTIWLEGANLINCAAIERGAGNNAFVLLVGHCEIRSCTVLKDTGLATGVSAFAHGYGSGIIYKNVACFGPWTNHFGTTSLDSGACGYNATNAASAPGSNNQTSKTTTSQFEGTAASGGFDLRVKSGSDLASNGTRDDTYTADADIVGSARSTTAPTIGAWEYSAGGGAAAVPEHLLRPRLPGVTWLNDRSA